MKLLFYLIIISFFYARDAELNRINYSKFSVDSIKHLHQLGRDKDPKKINDVNPIKVMFRKVTWEILSIPGLRFMTRHVYPKSTISHFDRMGAVAFTIDDGFCSLDNKNGCLLEEVRSLLKSYDASATFFISGSHCQHVKESTIKDLINDGHELANHNMMDWPYDKYTSEEFLRDLNFTENILLKYRSKPSTWYRAPFGRISKEMQKIIDDKKMVHVVTDAFANDTTIPDAKWISNFILRKVKPGSIILIHMPEKNVREWNLQAMKETLEGLKQKNYKIVNLTKLYKKDY